MTLFDMKSKGKFTLDCDENALPKTKSPMSKTKSNSKAEKITNKENQAKIKSEIEVIE